MEVVFIVDLIVSIALGCYSFGKLSEENSITMNNKTEARANNCPYYKDSRGRYWATYTGEQCIHEISSPSHNGHDIIIGIHSNRIYKDFTQDKLDEQNKQFEYQGKTFRLKEYKDVTDKTFRGVSWKSTFWLYDINKGKPYKIETTREFPRTPERYYTKVYLKPQFGSMHRDTSINEEILSMEDVKKWRP